MSGPMTRRMALLGLAGSAVLVSGCASEGERTSSGKTAGGPDDRLTSDPTPEQAGSTIGSASGPVVYLVPHQDDELISMVGGITTEVATGEKPHVLLVTDGGWSNLPKEMCERKIACPDKDEFIQSRMQEMVGSLSAMGVPESQFHKLNVVEEPPGYPDRVIAAVEQVIKEFGPGVRLRTMSWLDAHPAHLALGYAVDAAARAGRIGQAYFFQSPLYQVGSSLAKSPVATPKGIRIDVPRKTVRTAVEAYRRFMPRRKRFSVGWISVSNQLRWVEENHFSWRHEDSSKFSPQDEVAAKQWVAEHQSPDSIPRGSWPNR